MPGRCRPDDDGLWSPPNGTRGGLTPAGGRVVWYNRRAATARVRPLHRSSRSAKAWSHPRPARRSWRGRGAAFGAELMAINPLAGRPAPPDLLIDVVALERE